MDEKNRFVRFLPSAIISRRRCMPMRPEAPRRTVRIGPLPVGRENSRRPPDCYRNHLSHNRIINLGARGMMAGRRGLHALPPGSGTPVTTQAGGEVDGSHYITGAAAPGRTRPANPWGGGYCSWRRASHSLPPPPYLQAAGTPRRLRNRPGHIPVFIAVFAFLRGIRPPFPAKRDARGPRRSHAILAAALIERKG
jgi:hypothetical protein